MEFIGVYWWAWLIGMVIFGGYAIYNQVKRIKGMMVGGFSRDINLAFSSFRSGILSMVVSLVIAGISSILLLLSVIINLIIYLR